jgi:hypothetical protein
MKDIFSAWITNTGQFIPLKNYAEHDEYARKYLVDKYGFTNMMIMLAEHKPRLDYPYEYLISMGWIKMSLTTEYLTLTYIKKEFCKRQWETIYEYMKINQINKEKLKFDKTNL